MGKGDIFGIGKVFAIEKLLDVISKSVGRISKSHYDRKDADTKAYEIKVLSNANTEAKAEEIKIIAQAINDNFSLTGNISYNDEKISIKSPSASQISIIEQSIEERTQERVSFQEEKKQLNIESITSYAVQELINEPPISNEPLDEDWTNRFFRIIEDISNDEMQVLWGKILAGEVKQPKSFSLRTLELIRNLSKDDADLFNKVAKFAVRLDDESFIFKGKENNHNKLEDEFNIKYIDIAHLMEIGLIQAGENLVLKFQQVSNESKETFIAGNINIIISIKANTPTASMSFYKFSQSGNELLKLIKLEPLFEYLEYFADSLRSVDFEVKYEERL